MTRTAVYDVVHGVYGPCTPRHGAYQVLHKLTIEICGVCTTLFAEFVPHYFFTERIVSVPGRQIPTENNEELRGVFRDGSV